MDAAKTGSEQGHRSAGKEKRRSRRVFREPPELVAAEPEQAARHGLECQETNASGHGGGRLHWSRTNLGPSKPSEIAPPSPQKGATGPRDTRALEPGRLRSGLSAWWQASLPAESGFRRAGTPAATRRAGLARPQSVVPPAHGSVFHRATVGLRDGGGDRPAGLQIGERGRHIILGLRDVLGPGGRDAVNRSSVNEHAGRIEDE